MRTVAELENLKEIASISAGNISTAMSKLTGRKIEVQVPEIGLASVEEVASEIADENEEVVVSLVQVSGDIEAVHIFVGRKEEMMCLSEKAMALGVGLDEVWMEMANILSGSTLTALGKLLGLKLEQTPPDISSGMWRAVSDAIFANIGGNEDEVFLWIARYVCPASHGEIKSVLVCNVEATKTLLAKMKS